MYNATVFGEIQISPENLLTFFFFFMPTGWFSILSYRLYVLFHIFVLFFFLHKAHIVQAGT